MPSIENELFPLKSSFRKLKKIFSVFSVFGEPDRFIMDLIFDLTSMFERLQNLLYRSNR